MVPVSPLDAAKVYLTPPSSPLLRPVDIAPENQLGLWLPQSDATGSSAGPPDLPFGPIWTWDGELELLPISRRMDLGPLPQDVVQPPFAAHTPATMTSAGTGSLGLSTQPTSNAMPQTGANATAGAGSLNRKANF